MTCFSKFKESQIEKKRKVFKRQNKENKKKEAMDLMWETEREIDRSKREKKNGNKLKREKSWGGNEFD